jgi:chromosome segregation ATPase
MFSKNPFFAIRQVISLEEQVQELRRLLKVRTDTILASDRANSKLVARSAELIAAANSLQADNRVLLEDRKDYSVQITSLQTELDLAESKIANLGIEIVDKSATFEEEKDDLKAKLSRAREEYNNLRTTVKEILENVYNCDSSFFEGLS